MGLDEVGTARTLREHLTVTEALVAKHGGRPVKTTGNAVLLEFTSVVDAVGCAVAVQAVMAERNQGIPEDRRMLFRIDPFAIEQQFFRRSPGSARSPWRSARRRD
jgi:class 3 adenylate cyclase